MITLPSGIGLQTLIEDLRTRSWDAADILSGISDIYIRLSLLGKSAPKDRNFAAPEALIMAASGVITNLNK